MEPLNRLFGKEISNFVDNSFLVKHRNRNSFGQGKKTRGLSIHEAKNNSQKPLKQDLSQNIPISVNKISI
jgi:hypothetical protein